MEELRNMLHQVGQLYQKLTKRQRIVIAASVGVVIALLVGLALYKGTGGTASGYGVLIEDTDPSNAAAIVSKLEQNGIPYQIQNERTILVPAEQVARQRMMVASEGLIKSSRVGYEIFDTQQFGATENEQKVRLLRALEGELAKTIEGLEPIRRAEVRITVPNESVFTERQVPPTAGVTVHIKSGLKLSRKQIDGIKSIVAPAVPKLTIENVNIVDQNGIRLDNQELYESEQLQEQEKYRKELVAELEEKIVKALAPHAGGENKVASSVFVHLDAEKKDIQSEVYDPNTVIRSEQTLKEEGQQRKDPSIQGVPGAVSNIGPVEGLEGSNLGDWYKKEQNTVNNEVSKTVTRTQKTFASIDYITARASIPKRVSERLGENGELIREFSDRSANELASIERLVQGIIGFNAARGDSVLVLEYEPGAETELPKMGFYERYVSPFLPWFKYIVAAVLLFIFYKKVIAPFTQKMLADVAEGDEEYEPLAAVDEAEDDLEKLRSTREKIAKSLGLGGGLDEDALQYDVLIENLRLIINERPQEVATLLQTLVENELSTEGGGWNNS